jgi:hypothetical protein
MCVNASSEKVSTSAEGGIWLSIYVKQAKIGPIPGDKKTMKFRGARADEAFPPLTL